MGMITILASVVLVAVNPLRQFAQARNSQRISNVHAILNAIGNRLAENRGIFTDDETCTIALPGSATAMARNGYDMRPCLVPLYLSEFPFDPATGSNTCASIACGGDGENYASGYTVAQDTGTGRVTVCAPGAAEPSIEGSGPYCLTR